MFSQSFESMISIIFIPPLVFLFIWEGKDKRNPEKGNPKGNDLLCPMFTGIIETTGKVIEIKTSGSNTTFWIKSSISSALKVDQSVSHSGVCLTVEEIKTTATG